MAQRARTSRQLYRHLVALYAQGSTAAVVVVLFLVFIGLEFNGRQWLMLFAMLPAAISLYVFPDIYLIARHYRPIGDVLEKVERGETPASSETSRAIVRALNLPYYSFLRVVLFHGPAAAMAVLLTLYAGDAFLNTNYEPWQALIFATIVFFFASPTHAIFEFFSVSRCMVPVIERLYPLVGTLDREQQNELRSVGLKKKLLYLAIFVTSLPLLFLAGSVTFKVSLLFARMGSTPPPEQTAAFLVWVFGVVAVCMVGALIMSVLTAAEVSSSAERLRSAMKMVEGGNLDVRLQITSTDEYADLFRGFNLMTEGLHEEVKILGISQDLMGELHLDLLLERIMRATTDLLDADRSTLFLYDPKSNELWSRFAEGLGSREIRIPANQGIAGSVFSTGQVENIADAAKEPRFNPEVDKATGYQTKSILAIPVVNKAGQRIGVTQVLNKLGGPFTTKDESRLRAFTAQVAIALENAKLFDDVLRVQNYNESILRSTSNAMITLNTERRVVTANAATLKLLKVGSSELVGADARAVFAPPNDWVLTSLTNVETSGERDLVVDAELRIPSGEIASVNLTSVPLIDASQAKIGSMLILEDISNEKRVKSTMSRYMSKEVVDQLLQSGETALGGQIQRVSVLFSDIRDFTTVTESIGARETVSMLNEYFGEMVDVIFRHKGILDKYIGDAIMALFGAPFHGPHDADNAARTAINMIVMLRALNDRRVAANQRPIEIGVGVNTGDVVVGSIGSPKRMEYTAIGDSVNLASRLEGACKVYGVKAMLSEFTVRALTEPIQLRELDFMKVKGKEQPVAIYEALDHHTPVTFPNLNETLACYARGLDAYRKRDWQGARSNFESALLANPNDVPSRVFRDRSAHFAASPPGEDWDGVWVLKEK
jgi:adenylate cyclase